MGKINDVGKMLLTVMDFFCVTALLSGFASSVD